MKYAIVLILFLFPLALFASLEKELNSFFEQLGSSSNVNSAEIYNGQKAGYATGGGYTLRNRSIRLQPVTINLPRFDAGCGGIDIYTGGISFVNSEQLIQTLKSIGSSSIGYAFMLGLETVSPQVASTIKQMQTWANAINANSINSCETASQLVGSVWPKNAMASQHICQTTGTHYGWLSDHINSRHDCSTEKTRNDINVRAQDQNPDLLFGNYNVVWEAIRKQGFLTKDNEIAEFLMSLMGTIIVRDSKIEVYPAKATDEGFLKAFFEGGEAVLYSCDSQSKGQCLVIRNSSIMVQKGNSWSGKIERLLLSMQEKILRDEELSNEERELLIKTNIPLYRFLNVLTAYKRGICPIDLKQISDIVAMHLLVQYIRDTLENVRFACINLKNHMAYGHQIDEYLTSLLTVERNITHYDKRAQELMEQELYILQKMDLLEAQIASELCL